MGASVGVGGLIIGISMLVVFSMAVTSLNSQTATSLEVIESAHTPEPLVTIDNAIFRDVIDSIVLIPPGATGTGYVDGTLVSADCPEFSVEFTTTGGEIDPITQVINRGICTSLNPVITVLNQPGSNGDAAFTGNVEPYLYVNVTNSGTETLSTTEAWVFFDGSSPTTIQSNAPLFNPPIRTNNWFSGETIALICDSCDSTFERLSLTVGGTSISRTID
jgi:archaellum component FlaF (FlaF/FlaG flagellin family)